MAPTGSAPRILRRDEVTSTQDEALRLLAEGARPPFAVAARHQSRGRGRLGRAFASPAGASLALTLVHRTALAPARRGWFPQVAGLAALAALESVLGDALGGAGGPGLKWPNDLHTADGRKLGGILVEARGEDLVLLGVGLNLRGPVLAPDGAPVPGAAWLLGEDGLLGEGGLPGGDVPGPGGAHLTVEALRERLETALADALSVELGRLESTGGDAVSAGIHGRYTMTCLTLGCEVRVDPLGEAGAHGAQPPSWHGIAREVDACGRLVVDLAGGGRTAVDIGDVRHLRPDGPVRSDVQEAMSIEQEEHGT